MSATAGQPTLQEQVQEGIRAIETALYAPVPHGFKYRLLAQIVLCCVLFLGAAVYTVLHTLYSRRFGRPLWLFRIQRSGKSGRRVAVVNSLPVIVLLALLSAPLLCAGCILLYRNFIDRQPGYNYIAVAPAGNLVVAMQAWIFSASNLQATLTSRRRLGAKPSILSVPWVSNFTLLGFPAIWAIALMTVSCIANARTNSAIDIGVTLLRQLESVNGSLQAGAAFDPTVLLDVPAQMAGIKSLQLELAHFLYGIASLSLLFCSLIIVMNLYSLSLVLILRRQVKSNRERSAMFRNMSEVAVTAAPLVSPRPPSAHKLAPVAAAERDDRVSSSGQQPPRPTEAREVALARLTSDLSYGVPITTTMALVFAVSNIVLAVDGTSSTGYSSWHVQELVLTAFTWTYVLGSVTVVSWFTINLCRAWWAGRSDAIAAEASFSRQQEVSRSSNDAPLFSVKLQDMDSPSDEVKVKELLAAEV